MPIHDYTMHAATAKQTLYFAHATIVVITIMTTIKVVAVISRGSQEYYTSLKITNIN